VLRFKDSSADAVLPLRDRLNPPFNWCCSTRTASEEFGLIRG
jgi:hypothetical protein